MKNRLIVTVSDVNGTKSYNLNKVIKKVLIYTTILVLSIFIVSFILISNLNNKLDTLTLQEQQLKTQNKLYNLQIQDKVRDLKELGNTLKDIEAIIGVKGDDEHSLIDRATLAKLTSSQKSYILKVLPNGSPLAKTTVTASFGWRIHPITKTKKHHNGIDLRAKRKTNVFSTADGVVKYVQNRNKGSYGRMVVILHNFGFETTYAHLNSVDVKVGDVIQKGQIIAKSGNSGRSSGPHLHYEIKYANKVLNPKDFMKWNMQNYDKIFEKQRRVQWESLVKLISKQSQKLVQQ